MSAAGEQPHLIFTDEHEQLRESIRAFVSRELVPHTEEWERTTFPDSVFRRMGELGLLGLDKPEAHGGQGGDYITALVLSEELSRSGCGGLAAGIAAHTAMAMPPILASGSEEQKRQWLAPAIRGEKILCFAVTDPEADPQGAGLGTRAARDGDGWVIDGAKTYVVNGNRADAIVLVTETGPAPGEGGFTLFLVPMDSLGVTRSEPLPKLGLHAADTTLVTFQGVRVPDTARLGAEGQDFSGIARELEGERLLAAAGSVACAQTAFDRALTYALEREAFGRPIGKFQAIRHKFATMAAAIEAARELVYTTAWRFTSGERPEREIAMAKLYASRVFCDVADECLQIHGGAGYMVEYGIERIWRDAHLNRIGTGTDEVLLEVIGRSYDL